MTGPRRQFLARKTFPGRYEYFAPYPYAGEFSEESLQFGSPARWPRAEITDC
jgi:hypothetical protein